MQDRTVRRTLVMLVDNESGVLMRVVGLFSGRGYNIDSLTVSEVESDCRVSLITIVTSGSVKVITLIKHQLEQIVPVHWVHDATLDVDGSIEREMVMVKVVSEHDNMRSEALRVCKVFGAKVLDMTSCSFIFELAASVGKVEDFLSLLRPLGVQFVSRTGVIAIRKGTQDW